MADDRLTITNIKKGDKIVRRLAETVNMVLLVTDVDEDFIYVGGTDGWKFHRTTGYEVDEDLGWDGINKTGSRIIAHITEKT